MSGLWEYPDMSRPERGHPSTRKVKLEVTCAVFRKNPHDGRNLWKIITERFPETNQKHTLAFQELMQKTSCRKCLIRVYAGIIKTYNMMQESLMSESSNILCKAGALPKVNQNLTGTPHGTAVDHLVQQSIDQVTRCERERRFPASPMPTSCRNNGCRTFTAFTGFCSNMQLRLGYIGYRSCIMIIKLHELLGLKPLMAL